MSGPSPHLTTPPPLHIEHCVRVSALESEHLWKLHGDTLLIATGGQPDIAIQLSSVTMVRIAYEPTRMQLNRYRCYLYNASGKIATIQNEHYKGFASFEDRSPTYVPFLQALIHRIASLSPHCQFATGVSMLRWLANAVFLGLACIFLLIVIFFLHTAIGSLVIIKIIIVAFFIPAAVSWFMKNKPKTFSPENIPVALLPVPGR